MDPKFIHLCVHSDYSIISGLSKPKDLIQTAYDLNMPALGITDYGNFYGIIKFYRSAHKMGIKPILGVCFKLKSFFLGTEITKINVFAKNNEGYSNLIALISKAHTKENYFSSMPGDIIIDLDWLVEYKSGLIILSGGYNGDFGKYLLKDNFTIVNNFIRFYKKYFPESYYLEITRTNYIFEEEKYIKCAIELSNSKNIPIVATNNVFFITKSDAYAHKIRVAIQKSEILKSKKFNYQYSDEQFLKSETEMCSLFADIPEALKNSVEIAKRCNVIIKSKKYFLPSFPTGLLHVKDFLILKSMEGLNDRLIQLYPDNNQRYSIFKKYRNRLFEELYIINDMGFAGYFLIVMEFIQWAKNNSIPVGPGRGSGSGSLVAYVLKITELDPLFYDLLFERFLNPKRISMPDFDIDFCMEKRDLVILHVTEFYGKLNVSQIITFGTMSAKAVVRDVGRVLGYPYGFVNKISQLIPSDPGITLSQSLSKKFNLIDLYEQNSEVKVLIDTSKKLEGVIRNVGKHAGGIVISPTKLTDFTPLQYDDNNIFITQFDKNDIDYIGLLKFDFLGLKTLTVIDSTINMINSVLKKNKKKSISLHQIPLYDKKSFDLLQKAYTSAVFQLESYGMKNLILRLKPDCFEDIVSLIALFRPGPLQSGMVDNFINRKNKKEPIFYPDINCEHLSLRPILKSTYGIILYQEQVMKIAQVLAGYTLSKADILQRAMSKKKIQEMSKQKDDFQKSAQKNNISKNLAINIFNLLEKFAGYGFNKSHSVSYALISYQTLWMKANYPAEFMSSVMSADIYNNNKIRFLIKECISMKLKIIPPNINLSQYFFKVNRYGQIIYGLGAIKGVGKSAIESIILARERVKKFNNLFDFCFHLDTKKINKRMLEKLIFSGVFDIFKIPRLKLVKLISRIIALSNQYSNIRNTNQSILFKPLLFDNNIFINIEDNNFQFLPNKVELDFEKDALGFYLTANPIDEYRKELNTYTNGCSISNIYNFKNYKVIKIYGILSSIRFTTAKNNTRIVFLELIDGSYSIEVIIFDNLIDSYKEVLKKDNILIIEGRCFLNYVNKKNKFITNNIMDINFARNKYVKFLELIIKKDICNTNLVSLIKKKIKSFLPGNIPIKIVYKKKNMSVNFNLNKSWNVRLHEILINELKFLLGLDCVNLHFN